MDDPNMHAYGGEGPDDAEIGRRWRENSSLEKWFPLTAERLVALEAENAALKREAHTWWTAARDAAKAERARCALRVELHSQYPIETDYDRGYDKARKDAAETLRTMGDDAGLELGPNTHMTVPMAGLIELETTEHDYDGDRPRTG